MPIKDMLTISEAARKYGVTRQRMHILIKDHGVNPVRLHARCLLVSERELRKIPRERKNGIHRESA